MKKRRNSHLAAKKLKHESTKGFSILNQNNNHSNYDFDFYSIWHASKMHLQDNRTAISDL